MARPTKLTPDVQERICQAIQLGATYELAAQYGGVHYQTFLDWMEKGRADVAKQPYLAFYEAIKLCEGKAVAGWLAKIEKAASEGSWQAAAWKLERRYPKEYGRTVQEHQGQGKDGAVEAEVKLDFSGLTTEQLKALAAAFKE